MSDYPEHDKMKAVKERSQSIGEFVEWLRHEKNIVLARWEKEEPVPGEAPEDTAEALVPATDSITTLLAEFFKIDLNKVSAEKDKMLEDFRQQSAQQ
jgi:hypothetical protein